MEDESPTLITLIAMSKGFNRLQLRIIDYRSCKNFSNEKFKQCLLNEIKKEDFFSLTLRAFESFRNRSMTALKKPAPPQKKIAVGNQIIFMTKGFSE